MSIKFAEAIHRELKRIVAEVSVAVSDSSSPYDYSVEIRATMPDGRMWTHHFKQDKALADSYTVEMAKGLALQYLITFLKETN